MIDFTKEFSELGKTYQEYKQHNESINDLLRSHQYYFNPNQLTNFKHTHDSAMVLSFECDLGNHFTSSQKPRLKLLSLGSRMSTLKDFELFQKWINQFNFAVAPTPVVETKPLKVSRTKKQRQKPDHAPKYGEDLED